MTSIDNVAIMWYIIEVEFKELFDVINGRLITD